LWNSDEFLSLPELHVRCSRIERLEVDVYQIYRIKKMVTSVDFKNVKDGDFIPHFKEIL